MPAPIIAFSKDWDDDPTSNHHVLRELAKTRRVLWLNSVATRAPSLASGRDLRRVGRKLREFIRGPVNVENDLWVFTPLVLPLPHEPLARRVNRAILRASRCGSCARRLGMRRLPALDVPAERGRLHRAPRRVAVGLLLRRRVVAVLAASTRSAPASRARAARASRLRVRSQRRARRAKRAFNAETHVAPHGVDHALFARALIADTAVPADLARLPHPCSASTARSQDWVDVELLAAGRAAASRLEHRADRHELIGTVGARAGCRTCTCSAPSRTRRCPPTARASTSALIPYLESTSCRSATRSSCASTCRPGCRLCRPPCRRSSTIAQYCASGRVGRRIRRGRGERARRATRPSAAHERSLAIADETWAGTCGRRGRARWTRSRSQPTQRR